MQTFLACSLLCRLVERHQVYRLLAFAPQLELSFKTGSRCQRMMRPGTNRVVNLLLFRLSLAIQRHEFVPLLLPLSGVSRGRHRSVVSQELLMALDQIAVLRNYVLPLVDLFLWKLLWSSVIAQQTADFWNFCSLWNLLALWCWPFFVFEGKYVHRCLLTKPLQQRRRWFFGKRVSWCQGLSWNYVQVPHQLGLRQVVASRYHIRTFVFIRSCVFLSIGRDYLLLCLRGVEVRAVPGRKCFVFH